MKIKQIIIIFLIFVTINNCSFINNFLIKPKIKKQINNCYKEKIKLYVGMIKLLNNSGNINNELITLYENAYNEKIVNSIYSEDTINRIKIKYPDKTKLIDKYVGKHKKIEESLKTKRKEVSILDKELNSLYKKLQKIDPEEKLVKDWESKKKNNKNDIEDFVREYLLKEYSNEE